MAEVIGQNQVKLGSGQVVSAAQGGWYDGQQFWGGTLSNPGQINAQSNQVGAGQNVSNEVIAQTNPNNVAYVQQQQQKQQQNDPAGFNGGGNGPMDTGAGGGGAAGGGLGIAPPATLDLTGTYNKLFQSSGISDLEKKLADEGTAFTDAQSKINDNPFLSEASRTGRISKLTTDFNSTAKNLSDTIAMKKADVQTQLDLTTKQFDINSQSAQQSLSQFNSLLDSGALAGASGQDIANITRSTGLSSNMIQSAIAANQKKNMKTQTIQFDDGTNQGFAIIDQNTGQIISRQVVAASKPKSTGSSTKGQDQNGMTSQDYLNALTGDASSKAKYSLASLVQHYQNYLPVDKILQIYNQVSPNGKAKETLAQVKAGQYNYK